jgi:hypothetical protein
MTFHRLIEHELGGIILVNLHETVEYGIIPAQVQETARHQNPGRAWAHRPRDTDR